MEPESTDPDVTPEYSPSGVDLSLIRWMLSLAPSARLQFLEDWIGDVALIRNRNGET